MRMWLTLILISVLPIAYSYANETSLPEVDRKFPQPSVWIDKSQERWKKQVEELLPKQLKVIELMPMLANRLPKQWAIHFTEQFPSGGYHNPRMRAPDNTPTVFLSPLVFVSAKDAGLLAHEIFHMVHAAHSNEKEDWVKEGLALIVEALASRRLVDQIPFAFQYPTVSLMQPIVWNVVANKPLDPIEEARLETDRNSQYAQLQLFFYYAYRFCGGSTLIESLAFRAPGDDAKSRFNEALRLSRSMIDPGRADVPDYCSSLDALHLRFQKLKYLPQFGQKDGWLVEDPALSGRLLSFKPHMSDGGDIPPLSAIAYERRQEECPSGALALSPAVCLKVKGYERPKAAR